jgi:hypothetical protein
VAFVNNGGIEQVIAPKRETATLLSNLRVKFYVVASGFTLGERRRSIFRGEIRLCLNRELFEQFVV